MENNHDKDTYRNPYRGKGVAARDATENPAS
jgi:hypothetical protein